MSNNIEERGIDMLDDKNNKINNPMYLDKKVLKIVKTSLSNPESEISKIIKKDGCNCENNIDNISSSGKTLILNGGTAGE